MGRRGRKDKPVERSLPGDARILEAVTRLPAAGLRDLAQALGLARGLHGALRQRLRALKEEGLASGRKPHAEAKAALAGPLPEIALLVIAEQDIDGELKARPLDWRGPGAPPAIYLEPSPLGVLAPTLGDRIVARMSPQADGSYQAVALKRLEPAGERILGLYEETPRGGRISPADRKRSEPLTVPRGESGGAQPGEFVLAEATDRPRHGATEARVLARLGKSNDPRTFSLLALHAAGIPDQYPKPLLAYAEALEPPGLAGREDLRSLPLVTIDDEDARDFDDAVFAERDPEHSGGFRIVVAIADVAWYVRPGDPLDCEAERRGNSVYLPDRVVPMLPERLSNDLCSLRPKEDRPCLAAELWVDETGKVTRHRFSRVLMRSAARLTYARIQAAIDGNPDAEARALAGPIALLYEAFAVLDAEAIKRGALRLDLPEHKVEFDRAGKPIAVRPRPHYPSHRLIELFMVAANVAAARMLEQRRQPCMYRVHDQPSATKVEDMRTLFAEFGLNIGSKRAVTPGDFNRVLERAKGSPVERLVHETVLRAQAQAVYAPRNIGHFGLALGRYAHFTSPIRRYADLLVHRALIRGLELGAGGLSGAEGFAVTAEHISLTERRAAAAERDAIARFSALLILEQVKTAKLAKDLPGTVTGVTRFGLFVRLDNLGADGLIPIGALTPKEFLTHDERRHALVGRGGRVRYRLGDRLRIKLRDSDPLAGRLTFDLA
ncbi:MAG: VacB/RNase II family 3'-5' exoribonuclease [Alphaproteobacteria bacterium]|nr:VacB/RNase II family 3'-5' exoribonuclease [Alphaproteobacteria bacterium]